MTGVGNASDAASSLARIQGWVREAVPGAGSAAFIVREITLASGATRVIVQRFGACSHACAFDKPAAQVRREDLVAALAAHASTCGH